MSCSSKESETSATPETIVSDETEIRNNKDDIVDMASSSDTGVAEATDDSNNINNDDKQFSASISNNTSFRQTYDYTDDATDGVTTIPKNASNRLRILFLGLRRSGKTSISKVVFHKMQPNETLFVESTSKITKEVVCNSAFVDFDLWDFPGQTDINDPSFDDNSVFSGRGTMIYVIDAQDEYAEALTNLHETIAKVYKINPTMNFEIFVHKIDGLTDDNKTETQRDIYQRVMDDLPDSTNGSDRLRLNFHMTSIYDHTIYEALSKVVQRLIPQMAFMENLLNLFVSNSAIEKAFLYDVMSKMYIATDSSPVDMQSYELCCDMIDVITDISCIYGVNNEKENSAFDDSSSGVIKLNNGTVLYFREVGHCLAVLCILREENYERRGVIHYNVLCFRDAVQKFLTLMEKKKNKQENENE